ncbi:MAG: SMC family ATPase [Anaerolineae bacterium]|jgi:exonuclease SbcC
MVPEKLVLKNFMCYRQATLDFAGIRIACLAGENGAGKSALLDATTWALWGNSRVGARQDDNLIRLGEEEMAVELTFAVGGETYRVLRQRKAGKRGRSVLDFQVITEGRWRSLTEGGIRATQQRIEDVIKLDYDTFLNSAFLRQGRADEFTVKTAAERKRVLGDILGLDRWSVYEGRAKDRHRALEGEAEANRLRLEEIESEVGRRSEFEDELAAAQASVAELSEAVATVQREYQRIETARTELRHREVQMMQHEERVRQAEQELSAIAAERGERQKRLDASGQLLAQREAIEVGYLAYREAVEQERKLGERLRQAVELDERRRELESGISLARHQLEARLHVIDVQIGELESRLPTPDLIESLDETQAQLEHLARLAESREAAKEDLADIAQEQAALQAWNEALRREMGALKERIEVLREADAQCPLCEQPLTEKHRVDVLDRIESDGRDRGDTYRSNQIRTRQLTEQASDLEDQIRESAEGLREVALLQKQLAALIERREQGRQAATELETRRTERATLATRLVDEDFALGLRRELEAVLLKAEELGYDTEAHEEARSAVAAGQVFAERKAQLDTVQDRIEQERAGLERLAAADERWQNELAMARERRGLLKQEADALEKELENANAVELELHQMRAREAEARQRLGAAQQRLVACVALEQQRDDRLRRKRTLEAEQGIYEELRTAFGVRGVPAMIIEAAVPEIETEANRLLSRMTDGRMHVRFDTQRETKAGDVREALEIRIADELGTRPYENYSGGEQFRVNFAIRIALSKLLARRAGAQLQTLVVDEGFGTQDDQGRQRLVEAINTVQEDFKRILVITHISELRDAFPARIEVTKTPEGSTLHLL